MRKIGARLAFAAWFTAAAAAANELHSSTPASGGSEADPSRPADPANPSSDEISASDEFAAGTTAFSNENFAAALTHFERARALGVEGPAIHYNLGVCHYKLGDWSAARREFQVIADRYPDMRALAQYNLGLVALKESRDDEAEKLFQQAYDNTRDETIRALAGRQLGEPRPEEPKQWLTLVDARLGHDDNVLLLSEDIPLPDGQSAESRFTELWGLISGPISSGGGFRVDGSVYAVRYADAPIFDQSVLRAAAAYEWDWGDWGAEAGPHISYTTLDGDTFEQRIGVGLRLRRSLSQQTTLGLRLVHDEIDEGKDRFSAFGGSRNWLELRVDQDMTDGRLTFAYARENNDRRGSHVSADRDRLLVRYRHYFDTRWLADVQAAWRESRYGDIVDARDENLTELSVGVTRNLSQAWQIGGELSIGSNDSNVQTFAYDRSRMALGFTKQF